MQGLQVFSESNTEAVQGKKIIYLYRLLKEAATESAKGIANAAENTDILVENMEKVKKKMETNQQISDQLKAESDRFQGISDNLML